MKVFGREPALVLESLKALIVLVATLVPAFSAEAQTATVVIATALFGLLTALMTRPPEVAAITETIQVIGVALVGYGIAVSADLLSAIVLFSGAIVTLLQRSQISPAPVPANKGARRAAGQADLTYILKLCLIVLVVLVILWAIVQVIGGLG